MWTIIELSLLCFCDVKSCFGSTSIMDRCSFDRELWARHRHSHIHAPSIIVILCMINNIHFSSSISYCNKGTRDRPISCLPTYHMYSIARDIINLAKQGYCIHFVCVCVCVCVCVSVFPCVQVEVIHGTLWYHDVFMYYLLGSTYFEPHTTTFSHIKPLLATYNHI